MARRDVTGVLLLGGASRRFGSPKALATLDGETLAERAHRTLAATFDTVLAIGKASDELPLPFPVRDDGSDLRAPIVGVVAALRLSPTDLCVVVPTDMPLVSGDLLVALADSADGVDAAVVATGPLPGAYRDSARPVLERRIASGELALHRALEELESRVLEWDSAELANVNTAEELARVLT